MALVAGESGGISVLRGRMTAVSLAMRETARGHAMAEVRFQIDDVSDV
jgi:hypothetical protein